MRVEKGVPRRDAHRFFLQLGGSWLPDQTEKGKQGDAGQR